MIKFTPIITCEHAGNHVPESYQPLFTHDRDVLDSHEGWDPGAWEVATFLANGLGIKPYGCQISRLVIEANRSLTSAQLFSRFTVGLSKEEKNQLINNTYLPYREPVMSAIAVCRKPILHLSIHSFTPVFKGKSRAVEIGLLFDPKRKNESEFCKKLHDALSAIDPKMNIQYNEPYLGIDDGFTTSLRNIHQDDEYMGIEIEINQKFISNLNPIKNLISSAISAVVKNNF